MSDEFEIVVVNPSKMQGVNIIPQDPEEFEDYLAAYVKFMFGEPEEEQEDEHP